MARKPIYSMIEVGGLPPESKHKFRVRRKRLLGQVHLDAPFSQTTIQTIPDPPAAPINLLAGGLASGMARLEWEQPQSFDTARVIGYQVQQMQLTFVSDSDVVLGPWQDSETQEHSQHEMQEQETEAQYTLKQSCVVASVLPGETFRFRVRPISSVGEGMWSELYAEVELDPRHPDKPANLDATLGVVHPASTVLLKWQQQLLPLQCPVLGFDVQRKHAPDGEWLDAELDNKQQQQLDGIECSIGVNTVARVLRQLRPGQPYIFRVRTKSKAGAGEWVETLTAITMGVVHPDAVMELHSYLGQPTHTSIQLSWLQGLGIDRCVVIGYDIEQSIADNVPSSDVHDADAEGLSWTSSAIAVEEPSERLQLLQRVEMEKPEQVHVTKVVISLKPGTKYHFRVRPLSAAGAAKWTTTSQPIETGLVVPCIPSAVQIGPSLPAHSSVSLSWDQCAKHASCLHASYEVQAVVTGGDEWFALLTTLAWLVY